MTIPARIPGGPRILLAQHNAQVREHARDLLRSRGSVLAVADAQAVLSFAWRQPPNLIVADAALPGMDPAELLRQLRADPRTSAVPIVLLAARAEDVAAGTGPVTTLLKPLDDADLLACVEARLAAGSGQPGPGSRQPTAGSRQSVRRAPVTVATTVSPPAVSTAGGASTKSACGDSTPARSGSTGNGELPTAHCLLPAAHLPGAIEALSLGLFLLDTEGRFLYVNPASARMLARPVDELLGRNLWELYPDLRGTFFEAELRRAAAEQVAVQVEGRSAAGRWREFRVDPVPGGLAVSWHDVTERREEMDALRDAHEAVRAERRQLRGEVETLRASLAELRERHEVLSCRGEALSECLAESRSRQVELEVENQELEARCRAADLRAATSELLLSAAGPEAMLRELARVLVTHLADWCVLDLIQADGARRRVAVAHADSAREPLMRELQCLEAGRDPLWRAAHVARDGEPQVYHTGAERLAAGCVAAAKELLRQLGDGAVLMMPLLAGGRPLGVLTLGAAPPCRYEPGDVCLVREIADRVASRLASAPAKKPRPRTIPAANGRAASVLPALTADLAGAEASLASAGEGI